MYSGFHSRSRQIIDMYLCVLEGERCSFFGKFGGLHFLVTAVLRFTGSSNSSRSSSSSSSSSSSIAAVRAVAVVMVEAKEKNETNLMNQNRGTQLVVICFICFTLYTVELNLFYIHCFTLSLNTHPFVLLKLVFLSISDENFFINKRVNSLA